MLTTTPYLTALFLASSESGREPVGLMQTDVSLIVWTWVSFLLLLWILTRFAWGPIQKLLSERAEKIEGEIDRARRLREDAEQTLADYRVKLDKVREEAEALLEKGRVQGEELSTQLEQRGRKDAEEIRERATREIDLMINKARSELRGLVADLALQAAEKVVKKSLADEDHRRYADEAIEAIGALKR